MIATSVLTLLIGCSVAYSISRTGLAWWRTILGFVVGLVAAWIGGGLTAVYLLVSDNYAMDLGSLIGRVFWVGLVCAGAGVFSGRRAAQRSNKEAM